MSIAPWLIGMTNGNGHDGSFWPLVGRMSVVFGLPLAVPILAAFYWLGTVSARVDGVEFQQRSMLQVIGGLVTLSGQESTTSTFNTAEIVRLRDKVDQMLTSRVRPSNEFSTVPPP